MRAKDRLQANAKAGKAMASGFLSDNRAQSSGARTAVALIVSLMVALLITAFLLPIGLDEIVDVDTSNWSSGAQSLWDILDVIAVFAVFLFFIGVALAARDRV